jgi:hypothetical protein
LLSILLFKMSKKEGRRKMTSSRYMIHDLTWHIWEIQFQIKKYSFNQKRPNRTDTASSTLFTLFPQFKCPTLHVTSHSIWSAKDRSTIRASSPIWKK